MKLHLCCGSRNFGPDWIHIDGGNYSHLKYSDITHLPFRGNTVDLIYCSHGIAYFDREEIVWVLNEWKRVLKPGGVLRIATPDVLAMMTLYVNQGYSLNKFLGPLYGSMQMGRKKIYHKTTYDLSSLAELLFSVGFKEVKKYDWRQTEHAEFDDCSQAYLPHMDKENGKLISLNVECIK